QFDTDLDTGDGEFNVQTVMGSVFLNSHVSDTVRLTIGFSYLYEDYDFDGTTGIGGLDPWEDIHTQRIRLVMHFDLSNDWSVYAGALAMFAGESGASSSDSDTYGGTFGFTYRKSADLTWGIGAIIIDQLEDDARFFPAIQLNWQFKPAWRLTSFSNVKRVGFEVIYAVDPTLECGLGVGYEYNRFRLDDKGFASDGIGRVTGIPLMARLGWKPSSDFTLSVYGGAQLGGEIRIENSRGSKLREDDFDPAFFAGVSVSFRF
ncbi:MAG: hypothetical protein O7G85_12980, partial [Planctomycetota bacterium]|nr:hypothetical protein [Planctomycetota bacterium]